MEKVKSFTILIALLTSFLLPVDAESDYFTPVAPNIFQPMDLWGIFTINAIDAEVGDEVGVFVGDDCFGAYVVDTPGWYGFLHVYQNDPTTPEKDGAEEGDVLTIKIWDSSGELEHTISAGEYSGPDPLLFTLTVDREQVDIAACISIPEVCDDGVDNDCDGLLDCADPDCNCEDLDRDGVLNEDDNCPLVANPNQLDTYPPGGNSIGDACDCECDFDCDGDVDADDVASFLADFGRFQFNNPCANDDPCNGDCECDTDVDADDVEKLLEDFGRFQFNNPCPDCAPGDWCVYP